MLWLALNTSEEDEAKPPGRLSQCSPYPDKPPPDQDVTTHQPPSSPEEKRANQEDSIVVIHESPGERHNASDHQLSSAVQASQITIRSQLKDALNISRALRPLMRRVPSKTQYAMNEQRTVEFIADTGIRNPILEALPTRWLDIALVVDQTPSMLIWEQRISELRLLFETHGAFRDVRCWRFTPPSEQEIRILPGLSENPGQQQAHAVKELVDPTQRRLICVASDCVARYWRNGSMQRILETWSKHNLVTIFQVLPSYFWDRTALGALTPGRVHTTVCSTSNQQLDGKYRASPFEELPKHPIWFPVVTWDAKDVADWAKLITGDSQVDLPARTHRCDFGNQIVTNHSPTQPSTIHIEQRIARFYQSTLPQTQLLARYLAAVDLNRPIIDLILSSLLREVGPEHLAELMLSGLLRREQDLEEKSVRKRVEFDFVEGIRDRLLDSDTRSELHQLASLVSDDKLPQLPGNPEQTAQYISAGGRSVVGVRIETLRRLGGKYHELADWIETTRIITVPISPAEASAVQPPPGQNVAVPPKVTVGISTPNEIHITITNQPINGKHDYLFEAPFNIQSLPQHYARLDEWITAASNQLIQKGLLVSTATQHERLQQVGAALFDALFPKGTEARGLYFAQAAQAERSGKPLRIRLEVDQTFTGIPWNILWDTLYRRWLAQDHSRTLIQTPAGSTLPKLKVSRKQERLHVVLVTASAAHPASAEADQRYAEQLREYFAQHQPHIYFEVIAGTDTRQRLERRLQQNRPIHVLDIFAHGNIDGGEPILGLTDQKGDSITVPSTWLRAALRQRRVTFPNHQLLLTLLNNCHSAHNIPHSLLTGLAEALVSDGMPAVLEMQSQVSVETVYTFMPMFYQAILSGLAIDQALNSARQTIYNGYYSAADWAVPVLYVGSNVRNLRLLITKRKSSRTTTLPSISSVGISRAEFLAAHRLLEGDGRSQLFAKRSEDFQDRAEIDAIFVEGPLKRLAPHDPNLFTAIMPGFGPRQLSAPQSLFVLAPPGYGKTGYRLVTERIIKSSELILSIDLGIVMEEAGVLAGDNTLALIKRKVVETLRQQFPQKDVEIQGVLEKKVGTQPLSFGKWIERVVELVRSYGFQQAHFMFDGVDNLEQNFAKEFLTHLIGSPALLRIPGFAFKFFLPDDDAKTMQHFIITQLGARRADFPIYRLVRWEKPQLMKFLNRRLDHFTIKERAPSQPPSRLQDLFDAKVASTIEERLCTAAQGSPRRLIELLECMVDQHCATCLHASDHIPQAVVDACLRGYV